MNLFIELNPDQLDLILDNVYACISKVEMLLWRTANLEAIM